MAEEVDIQPPAYKVFIGEDKVFRFPIYTDPTKTVIADVSAWQLRFDVRRKDKDPDPALFTKSLGAGITVTGTFNADPVVNTQRVEVAIEDDDTYDPLADEFNPKMKAGKYRYSLKRMNAGSETVLAYGDFVVLQATVR